MLRQLQFEVALLFSIWWEAFSWYLLKGKSRHLSAECFGMGLKRQKLPSVWKKRACIASECGSFCLFCSKTEYLLRRNWLTTDYKEISISCFREVFFFFKFKPSKCFSPNLLKKKSNVWFPLILFHPWGIDSLFSLHTPTPNLNKHLFYL